LEAPMSYILEALRKSERDRLAAQAPSLPSMLADPPRRRPHWMIWLLAGLLAINGLGLGWLWVSGRGKPVAPVPPPTPIARPAPATPASQADVAPGQTIRLEEVPAAKPLANPPPSPAPLVRKPAPPSAQAEAKPPRKPQPEPLAKPEPRAAKPPKPARDEEAPLEEAAPPAYAQPQSAPRSKLALLPPISPEARSEATAASRTPARDAIPWLNALPAEFRQRLPEFRINIFAYSPDPEERFAIIDMQKYRVGERIPGDALLLEIRADCLILELDGQKFRYPRP